MFFVTATSWKVTGRGTPQESRVLMAWQGGPQESGPFETRASAEAFARGLATQDLIAKVEITEVEDDA